MLYYAIVFAVLALLAGVLGFVALAALSPGSPRSCCSSSWSCSCSRWSSAGGEAGSSDQLRVNQRSCTDGSEAAGRYARHVVDQARDRYDRAEEAVRQNPVQSVAMVFGIGLIAGLAIRAR